MFRPKQLTFGNYGHTLNRRQVLSPDGQWAIYDTRNDDTHLARADAIEMVHLDSSEIVRLYQTEKSSFFGPGVGAVAFHPTLPKAILIHGLNSCSESNPYSAARRFGAIINTDSPHEIYPAESRCTCELGGQQAAVQGVLHGGTHAHSWNERGWISFTYNDAWLEQRAKVFGDQRDQRTVGFMIPVRHHHPSSMAHGDVSGECFEGRYHAFLAANLSQSARPDSDDIEQAVEECWLGNRTAIAFQGAVRDRQSELHHEIFVTDLPDLQLMEDLAGKPCTLQAESRLAMIEGARQRRLTHTLSRKYPGLQGPRCWLVASPDGRWIYSLMKDDSGTVQCFRCSSETGELEQVTDLEHSIEGQLSLSPDGEQCVFICDQRLCLVSIPSGETVWLTGRSEHEWVGAVHFAGKDRWLCNAYVGRGDSRYLQVFSIE